MEEILRTKNKQIHQLLEDIESNEKESLVFQEQLVMLRNELKNATNQIESMTIDYLSMKDSYENQGNHVDSLQSENKKLRTLIEEHYEERVQREKHMESARLDIENQV